MLKIYKHQDSRSNLEKLYGTSKHISNFSALPTDTGPITTYPRSFTTEKLTFPIKKSAVTKMMGFSKVKHYFVLLITRNRRPHRPHTRFILSSGILQQSPIIPVRSHCRRRSNVHYMPFRP